MNIKSIKNLILLLQCSALCFFTHAQQMVTTTVGTPAKFEIEVKINRADQQTCGISVTRPNGISEFVTLRAPEFKATLSYTPPTPGTSVISWKGETVFQGKSEDLIVGGVKQLFNNLGEILTLKNMSTLDVACPGNGTITVVANPNLQPSTTTNTLPPPPPVAPVQTVNKFRSTATIPSVMNPPIESSDFKNKYSTDSTYRSMVDDFNVNRTKQSLVSLRLYSELGDANAQFMYGLAHLEDWTGLYDQKRACYWIREAAVKGLSQARLVIANKAIYNKECFDIVPTLDEAKTWAQLASMSSEKNVKENADKLLQDILRLQFANQR
jgi:hypothetical protein